MPNPPRKEKVCALDISKDRHSLSITGDSPTLSSGEEVTVTCGGGPDVQIFLDGKSALIVECKGDDARLETGDDADVGPYEVSLAKAASGGGVTLTLVLTD